MSTRAITSLEEYVHTSYPDLDREYVRGEVVERTVPVLLHGRVQLRLGLRFYPFEQTHRLFAFSEARLCLASDLYRIPDIMVIGGEVPPLLEAVTTPPLAVIEILSPDDRWPEVLEKCKESEQFGVKYIFLVDIIRRTLAVYADGTTKEVPALTIHGYPVSITVADLFD